MGLEKFSHLFCFFFWGGGGVGSSPFFLFSSLFLIFFIFLVFFLRFSLILLGQGQTPGKMGSVTPIPSAPTPERESKKMLAVSYLVLQACISATRVAHFCFAFFA